MTREEIEDAVYTACGVTTRSHLTFARDVVPDHPRAGGTFRNLPHPGAIHEFRSKLKRFLGELEDGLTVQEVLDLLEEEQPAMPPRYHRFLFEGRETGDRRWLHFASVAAALAHIRINVGRYRAVWDNLGHEIWRA